MKSSVLLAVSDVLLVLVAVFLFSDWKGSVSFSFGSPVSGWTFNIMGGARGVWVLFALFSLLLAAVLFVAGVAGILRNTTRA
jgi:hypothetical protein